MKYAISNIAWAPEERLDVYDAMSRIGVNGLEVAPRLFFHNASDPLAPSREEITTAIEETEARGLVLVSMQSLLFGVNGAALFEDAAARNRLIIGMEKAINLAGNLEVPNIVFGSPRQRRVPIGLEPEEALALAANVFQRLADVAHSAGTRIALEAAPLAYGTNFLNTQDEADSFVAMMNHPAIVSILDLGGIYVNRSLDTALARIPAMLPKLNHVHISEPNLSPAPMDSRGLSRVLKVLANAGYANAVSIEMRRPIDGVAGVVAALERLLSAIALAGRIR